MQENIRRNPIGYLPKIESQPESTKKGKFGDYGNKSRIRGINEIESPLFLPLIGAILPLQIEA